MRAITFDILLCLVILFVSCTDSVQNQTESPTAIIPNTEASVSTNADKTYTDADKTEANADKTDHLTFSIEEKEERSSTTGTQTRLRIRVSRPATKYELRGICERIIAEKTLRPNDSILFSFYLPNTDINGWYTAGRADLTSSGSINTGTRNYSVHRHKLTVVAGGITDELRKILESIGVQP